MRLVFLRFGCGGTSGIGRPENRKKRSAVGGTGRNRSSCVKNSMCRCRLIVKIKPVVQQAMSWKLKAKKKETSSIPCPFTADCKTRVTKAGLLTRSCFGAFPTLCQWQKSVETFCSLRSRNLQQRELLPIRTAFPFNSLVAVESAMRKPLHGKDSFFSGRCCRIVKKCASGRCAVGVFSRKIRPGWKIYPGKYYLWTGPAKRRVTGFETWCTDFLQYNLCKICLVSI